MTRLTHIIAITEHGRYVRFDLDNTGELTRITDTQHVKPGDVEPPLDNPPTL